MLYLLFTYMLALVTMFCLTINFQPFLHLNVSKIRVFYAIADKGNNPTFQTNNSPFNLIIAASASVKSLTYPKYMLAVNGLRNCCSRAATG